jgi:hypothetical protein
MLDFRLQLLCIWGLSPWHVTQHWLIVSYRSFGLSYPYQRQGSNSPVSDSLNFVNGTDIDYLAVEKLSCPETSVITKERCVTWQLQKQFYIILWVILKCEIHKIEFNKHPLKQKECRVCGFQNHAHFENSSTNVQRWTEHSDIQALRE